MKEVYLDHAATTYVKREVLEEMLPYFSDKFGNPSALYSKGRESRKAVDEARQKVAKALNAKPEEIYFTGSGTEADNWAIKGTFYANSQKGKHIITSAVEHHAVLNTCKYLESEGCEVTYIPVDKDGVISIDEMLKAVRPDTILISVMTANNEIGTLQPIDQIGRIAREKEILFHTDAVQAIGSIEIDVDKLGIDMLSLSAHKFYGPKGIGVLYVRKGTKLSSFLQGGGQESKKRAGTENVPAIVGIGKAIELASYALDERTARLRELRDKLIDMISNEISYVKLNGHRTKRLPGNVNFSFDYIDGESLLLFLDAKSISASSGSACSAGSQDPSHVLTAIGLSSEQAKGSVRFTIGDINTSQDIEYLMEVLPSIVQELRDMSPTYAAANR
ncbi:MAG: cysteine desulfurase NifS [Eubacteriales bacterium]|nr:cysteine desulfurase NifS [Eubacteriales bacterium]